MRAVTPALVVVGSLAFGSQAQALQLPPTPLPLHESQFQGGDGNQDDEAPYIDWQGLQLDERVEHTSDPQNPDNIFKSGKELEPDLWEFTTHNGGASPASANILDTYVALDRPPGGPLLLYLAFTREANNGTVFGTFELNQDARLWKNKAGSLVPCRTTNDVLISFEPHGNSSASGEIRVARWITDHTDPTSGCATEGHIEEAKLDPEVVQVAFAGTSINNFLAGFYPEGKGTIEGLKFGEAAINLSSVVAGLGNPCLTFSSTWMHSRSSSSSETADLKDFVAPRALKLTTCRKPTGISSTASGSLKRGELRAHRRVRHKALRAAAPVGTPLFDVAHLTGGLEPTGPITFKLYGPDDANCAKPPIFEFRAEAKGEGFYRSGAFATTRVGTYHWVVEYAGDINNLPAGPTKCDDEEETVVVGPATPSLSTQASGVQRHRGGKPRLSARSLQPIHDTATLAGGVAPTGTITFTLYGPDDSSCSSEHIAFTSTVPVSGNGTYNSKEFAPTAVGTYRWVAHYTGDANNDDAGPTECGDETETIVISKARPAIVTVASPAVVQGQPISDRATLSGGSDPTGKITFEVYGPDDETCSGKAADTSTADVSGNGSYPSAAFTPSAPGTYRWRATYSGDGDNEKAGPSTCDEVGESVVVAAVAPPVAPDLSTTASPGVPAGSPMDDTAALSGGSDPTGTITFDLYQANGLDCTAALVFVDSVKVSGAGSYTSGQFTPTTPGSYSWVVSYSGDEHNGPVAPTDCGLSSETVSIGQALPELVTTASPGITLGGNDFDSARLTLGSRPTGTIMFDLYGPHDEDCAKPPVFTTVQTVVGNGVYRSAAFAPDRAGTYQWKATYSGDANNAGDATECKDPRETFVVDPSQPTLSSFASVPGRIGLRHPVRAAGRGIFDAATLAGGTDPTGQITFFLYGQGDTTCSRPAIFTTATAVKGNGIYNSQLFNPSAAGTYRWRETYSGDANNREVGLTSCDDAAEHVDVTIPADPHLATTSSPAVTLGGGVSDTAHLSGGSNPTGTIVFHLYGPGDKTCAGTPVFTSTVTVAGNNDYKSGSFVPTAAGVYRWVARYSGDPSNNPAGPTTCGDASELAYVRPPSVTPVIPAFSTTASQPGQLGAAVYDAAHLSGGLDPAGSITFELFGPNNASCSTPPIFTASVAVTGNGEYRSAQFAAPQPGTYRWVATYSGDANNTGVGPTACGENTETASLSAPPAPGPDPGPNVTAPPPVKPPPPAKPQRKPTRRPKPAPPPPPVTG